jgi:hypothetical protein
MHEFNVFIQQPHACSVTKCLVMFLSLVQKEKACSARNTKKQEKKTQSKKQATYHKMHTGDRDRYRVTLTLTLGNLAP